jgi:hypothetical protein
MSFTVLFVLFTLFLLVVVFGLAYKLKGLKVALIATSATFMVMAALFVAMIYAITSVMPN